MTEGTDEKIKEIIYSRFQHIFEDSTLVIAIPKNGPTMGAPPRGWIPKAIEEIEALIETGMPINKACALVADKIAQGQNIEPKTVEMTYRRHQRVYWHEEFCRCVITKDLDCAVTAYKRLTPGSKHKLKLT